MPNVPEKSKQTCPSKDLNAGDTKTALYTLLYELESGCTCATSGLYAEAPLPGLLLTGSAEITLPLAERDACAILKKQAAINQGHCSFSIEISHDCVPKKLASENSSISAETLHHQWEMGADQMKPGNVAWLKFVNKVVDRAGGKLGMKTKRGGMRAALRGMHLSREDAQVDSHRLLIYQGLPRCEICLTNTNSQVFQPRKAPLAGFRYVFHRSTQAATCMRDMATRPKKSPRAPFLHLAIPTSNGTTNTQADVDE